MKTHLKTVIGKNSICIFISNCRKDFNLFISYLYFENLGTIWFSKFLEAFKSLLHFSAKLSYPSLPSAKSWMYQKPFFSWDSIFLIFYTNSPPPSCIKNISNFVSFSNKLDFPFLKVKSLYYFINIGGWKWRETINTLPPSLPPSSSPLPSLINIGTFLTSILTTIFSNIFKIFIFGFCLFWKSKINCFLIPLKLWCDVWEGREGDLPFKSTSKYLEIALFLIKYV